MKAMLVRLAVAVAFVAAAQTVIAHHSFSSEFDANKPIILKGVVTRLEWENPHTYFYMDVTEVDGKVVSWAMEMGSPNALTRQGWTRNSLKVGDHITVDGSPAKDGSALGNAASVVLESGKRVFAASSHDDPGQR